LSGWVGDDAYRYRHVSRGPGFGSRARGVVLETRLDPLRSNRTSRIDRSLRFSTVVPRVQSKILSKCKRVVSLTV
jgi:hypothetical protein